METGKIPPGHILHKEYRIVQVIDKGGMGAVYKAEDIKLQGRPVAIKEMSLSRLRQDEVAQAIERFKQEAQLLASLQHPNLPAVYGYFDESGRWYLAMAYIEGTTLDDRLKQAPNHTLSILLTLDIGIQLTKVLSYLHTRHSPIIFRDLKPLNVMITPEENVYLIDFGIARFFTPGKMKDTVLYVTKGYAAPEQYGSDQTSPQSDIYSLGVTLHQLLSGQDPQDNSPLFHFRPLQSYRDDIPHELASLVATMVNTDPTQRPASMIDVKEKLEQIQMQVRQGAKQQSHDTPSRENVSFRSSPIIDDSNDWYDVDLDSEDVSPLRKRASLAPNQPPSRTPPVANDAYEEDDDYDEYDDYAVDNDDDEYDNFDDVARNYTPAPGRPAPAPYRPSSRAPSSLFEDRYEDIEEDYPRVRRRLPSRPLPSVRQYTPSRSQAVTRFPSRPLPSVRQYTPSRSQAVTRFPSRPSRPYPAPRQVARIAQSRSEGWFFGTVGIALITGITAAILNFFNVSFIITLLFPLFIKFDIVSLLLFIVAGAFVGRIYRKRFSGFLLGAIAGILLVTITFVLAGMQDVYSLHFYISILLYAIAGAVCALLGAWLATL